MIYFFFNLKDFIVLIKIFLLYSYTIIIKIWLEQIFLIKR